MTYDYSHILTNTKTVTLHVKQIIPMLHTFHIPVMGLGYTVDTPIKVAKYGISSVVSIIEDNMIEKMRKFYSVKYNYPYTEIKNGDDDYRARRITSYLDLMNKIVISQFAELKSLQFGTNSELDKYFSFLPPDSNLKNTYSKAISMPESEERTALENELRNEMIIGDIDVNIMTKCDNPTYDKNGLKLSDEYSDAHSALRGYANSKLRSSLIFSAGLNPRLFSYCAKFSDFYPDPSGEIKKKIVLKVTDYRSALIQGKFLAKKGMMVSEFRIESGLNCGGHAFATDGLLLGPILEEFKEKRDAIRNELLELCNANLESREMRTLPPSFQIKLSVQGGVGTANEHQFLLSNYNVNSVGWGSPFLLVPEATSVETNTLNELAHAKPEDFYLSEASPLGIRFNNFKQSSSIKQLKERIKLDRPGSPCVKEFLAFNTEFTEKPICTASRQYQDLKIKQLQSAGLPANELESEISKVVEKECLCEGLSVGTLILSDLSDKRRPQGVAVCPGPNLAFFSGVHSLADMLGHIYGRINILNNIKRPSMFVNETVLYIDYLKGEIAKSKANLNKKQELYFSSFKENILAGLKYYHELVYKMSKETEDYKRNILTDIDTLINKVLLISTQVG